MSQAPPEEAAQGGRTKEQGHARRSWTQPGSLPPALPRSRQAYDPTQGGARGFAHTLSPHLLMVFPRLQEAKSTSRCSVMAVAPPSSTSPSRVPCSPSPARCLAVIHGSSPALPYMGTLHFLTFPALGNPKSAFLYALPPAPFVPLRDQGQVTDPTHPTVLPTQQQFLGVPLSHAISYHLRHHRCHPHPQECVPSPCSNRWSFPCPHMMAHVQQSRSARQYVPADRSMGKGLWCTSLSQRVHSLLSTEKLASTFSL